MQFAEGEATKNVSRIIPPKAEGILPRSLLQKKGAGLTPRFIPVIIRKDVVILFIKTYYMKIIIFTLVLVLTSGLTKAQNIDSVTIKKISDEILINGSAYENLRFLCKKIGPRLSGSKQAQMAVEATATMLKAAGADTVYLQPCRAPHWVRGKKETGYLELDNGKKKMLSLCALGNSVGTGTKGINGSVIEVNSFEQLNTLAEKVSNKIVFFNFPLNPTYINTFAAYGESYAARGRGAAKAAKYGAIGVLVRSLASNADDFPHTGVTVYNDSFPKIPAVAISTNDANFIHDYLKDHSSTLKVSFTTYCGTLSDALSYNVVGEIRGTKFPHEVITVGGHLDSWDLGEGAQDDGAGCVQSIEVLHVFKMLKIKPARTIRAVMFMDEEISGKGADKYLELAKANNEKHLLALESDAGGFTPRAFSLDMPEEKMYKVKQWTHLLHDYGVYEMTAGESGVDIEVLKELGTSLVGLKPDSQRYFDVHHSAKDTFESVSRRELLLGAVNMAAFVYLVAKYGL